MCAIALKAQIKHKDKNDNKNHHKRNSKEARPIWFNLVYSDKAALPLGLRLSHHLSLENL